MSYTPKADALKDRYCLHGIDWYYLCAELERENAALRAEVKVTRQNWEDYKSENAALWKDKERLDWIIGEAPYLFFKELKSDIVKGREQIDAARKEAQP